MDNVSFDWFALIILPLLIFFARIADVSLGTLRIIFVSKGYKIIAPLIGFIEILIWIVAISKIIQNIDNWVCYIAYAGGFAVGNYVGMRIEEKLAIGYELVRVITQKDANNLVANLQKKGFGITTIKAQGTSGEVAVIYLIINRKKIEDVVEIIKKYNPNALYTVEDLRFVSKEIFYSTKLKAKRKLFFKKK